MKPQSPFKTNIKEKKDYLAKVAEKVFGTKGYQSSSLQDVSAEAGISKAGVYYYFKTKEDLLYYIMIRNTDIFLDKLKRCVVENEEKGLSPQESFTKLIEIYAQHINSDQDKRSIVLRERHQLTGKRRNELYRRERAIFRLMRSELLKIDRLDKSIDPNVSSFLIIGMSHWVGYWFKEKGALGLDDVIRQNIRAIFRGILAK